MRATSATALSARSRSMPRYYAQGSATLGTRAVRRDRRRAEMPGVPEVVRPQPRDRGGRQDREDHVSSATSRSRPPRETRHATCGRYPPGCPSARLRSPPVACHRPVHGRPLRTIRQYVLVRNPYFHEWSADAQPDGYPERIFWQIYKKTSQAVSAVEHGAADWLYFTIPSINTQQTHEIETDYAAQTHPSAYPSTDVLVVEPNSPLSRDRAARQAIAYAIDRDRLHSVLNSGSSSLPAPSTCQLLPTNFPGYRPYCPYKLDPARAQKLVRRSPSYGKPVSVVSYVTGRRPDGRPPAIISSNF